MPGDDPLRGLADALNRLHRDAGIPSARKTSDWVSRGADRDDSVSHETVTAMLHGRHLPRWPKLRAVVRQFAVWAQADPDDQVRRFQVLWLRARGGDAPVAADVPDVPDGYWEGDALDLAVAAGGVVSMRRHGKEIRFALVGPDVMTLAPDEADEVALSLIQAARRARREAP